MPWHAHFQSLHHLDSTEGTVQLREKLASGLVLVPHPSPTDPNDPLRLPTWRKHVAFGAIASFTFLTNYAIGGLAPAFYILSREFDKTAIETSTLLLWPILVLGIFNFLWVPIANYLGKRPVFVFASLLLCIAYIWGGAAKSFDSLLWSNIVAAFAGSSTEALGAAFVNVGPPHCPLSFSHQFLTRTFTLSTNEAASCPSMYLPYPEATPSARSSAASSPRPSAGVGKSGRPPSSPESRSSSL